MNIKEQFNLEGKVAIITGSSKGIGKALALLVDEMMRTISLASNYDDLKPSADISKNTSKTNALCDERQL